VWLPCYSVRSCERSGIRSWRQPDTDHLSKFAPEISFRCLLNSTKRCLIRSPKAGRALQERSKGRPSSYPLRGGSVPRQGASPSGRPQVGRLPGARYTRSPFFSGGSALGSHCRVPGARKLAAPLSGIGFGNASQNTCRTGKRTGTCRQLDRMPRMPAHHGRGAFAPPGRAPPPPPHSSRLATRGIFSRKQTGKQLPVYTRGKLFIPRSQLGSHWGHTEGKNGDLRRGVPFSGGQAGRRGPPHRSFE
jgi:hypothetical protein